METQNGHENLINSAETNSARDLKLSWEKFRTESKLPEANFDIYYSPHSKAENLSEAKELFRKADIVFPENMGWQERDVDLVTKLSSGKISPADFAQILGYKNEDDFKLNDPFGHKYSELIFDSKKVVAFVDLPNKHELAEPLQDLKWFIDNQEEIIQGSEDFKSFLINLGSVLSSFGEANAERENYILQNLAQKVRQIVESNKDLQKLKSINILITMGSVHTGLSHRLIKEGASVNRKFSPYPHIYPLSDRATRSVIFGKKLDETVIARIFLENIFSKNLEEFVRNAPKNSKFHLKPGVSIMNAMDLDDASDLFNVYKQKGKKEFIDLLLLKFKEKGIMDIYEKNDSEK